MYYYYFFLLKNIYSWYIFMKIVQFLPNFKPYEWELSSVAWEFAKNFVSGNCWEVLNVVFTWGEKWVDWYEKTDIKFYFCLLFLWVLIILFLSFGQKSFGMS